MPKKNRAREDANGGASATPPHACAHCGACDKHDRCDHCGYCRKCGVYVMLPQVLPPIVWPVPYQPTITWGVTTSSVTGGIPSTGAYNGGSGCVDSGNTLVFFTAQALSSGASQIGPS